MIVIYRVSKMGKSRRITIPHEMAEKLGIIGKNFVYLWLNEENDVVCISPNDVKDIKTAEIKIHHDHGVLRIIIPNDDTFLESTSFFYEDRIKLVCKLGRIEIHPFKERDDSWKE